MLSHCGEEEGERLSGVGEKENTSSNTNIKKQRMCEVPVPESRVKISYSSSQMLPCW